MRLTKGFIVGIDIKSNVLYYSNVQTATIYQLFLNVPFPSSFSLFSYFEQLRANVCSLAINC